MTTAAPPADPSWDVLVRTHSASVYAQAHRLTGNRADAEDLVQDVFVRAFRALQTSAPSNLGGWLRRITHNLYLDRVRRQKKIHFVALPDLETQALVDARPQPAEVLDRHTFDPDVRRALEALSAATRTAVVLCDIDGLTYAEIATSLGVGRGTVRSRIHRGRRDLRAILRDRAPRTAPKDGRP